MQCKYCDAPLPSGSSPRRLFCSDAHKMRWHRQQQQDDQYEALLAELGELRKKVAGQAHTIELFTVQAKQQEEAMLSRIARRDEQIEAQAQSITELKQLISELEQENTQLKKQLDYERRYLEDTTPRTFKAWLKKQPSSPWRVRFLSDQLVPARTSRAMYQAQMKRLNATDEEMEDFVRLWKLMLSQS